MTQLPASLPTWVVAVVAVLVLIVVPVINGPATVEWIKTRFGKTSAAPPAETPAPAVLEQAATAASDFVAGRLLAEQDETAEYRREIRQLRDRIEQLLTEQASDRAELARLAERLRIQEGRADDR